MGNTVDPALRAPKQPSMLPSYPSPASPPASAPAPTLPSYPDPAGAPAPQPQQRRPQGGNRTRQPQPSAPRAPGSAPKPALKRGLDAVIKHGAGDNDHQAYGAKGGPGRSSTSVMAGNGTLQTTTEIDLTPKAKDGKPPAQQPTKRSVGAGGGVTDRVDVTTKGDLKTVTRTQGGNVNVSGSYGPATVGLEGEEVNTTQETKNRAADGVDLSKRANLKPGTTYYVERGEKSESTTEIGLTVGTPLPALDAAMKVNSKRTASVTDRLLVQTDPKDKDLVTVTVGSAAQIRDSVNVKGRVTIAGAEGEVYGNGTGSEMAKVYRFDLKKPEDLKAYTALVRDGKQPSQYLVSARRTIDEDSGTVQRRDKSVIVGDQSGTNLRYAQLGGAKTWVFPKNKQVWVAYDGGSPRIFDEKAQRELRGKAAWLLSGDGRGKLAGAQVDFLDAIQGAKTPDDFARVMREHALAVRLCYQDKLF